MQPHKSYNFKEASAHYHTLIHHLAENRCTWDLVINHTGQAIYCSASCKTITGYPPEVFLRNIGYLEKLIHQEDKTLWSQLTCTGQKSHIQDKEYRIIAGTGEVKWIASFIKPILLGDGANPGTLISSFDITPYRECAIKLEWQNSILRKRNENLVKQLSSVYCDNELNNNQVLVHNKEMEKNNKELLETNNALRVLAKNIDSIKKKSEKRLSNDIYKNIYPLVSRLKGAHTKTSRTRLIDSLLYKIDELCQTLRSENGTILRKSLTATEVKVAALIKEDMFTDQIASELKISPATVKTHRRNIRRKFKIQNSGINLSNYLKLKWQK